LRDNGSFKVWLWAFGAGFLVTLPLLFFDYGESGHPELDQAVRGVHFLSAPKQVQRSSFWILQGEKLPARFVEWMFSPLGSAEWAPAGDDTGLPAGASRQARSAIPSIPRGVRIVPDRPDPAAGRQVVVKADNARGMIVAEAYENPGEPPVFTREWSFLKLGKR